MKYLQLSLLLSVLLFIAFTFDGIMSCTGTSSKNRNVGVEADSVECNDGDSYKMASRFAAGCEVGKAWLCVGGVFDSATEVDYCDGTSCPSTCPPECLAGDANLVGHYYLNQNGDCTADETTNSNYLRKEKSCIVDTGKWSDWKGVKYPNHTQDVLDNETCQGNGQGSECTEDETQTVYKLLDCGACDEKTIVTNYCRNGYWSNETDPMGDYSTTQCVTEQRGDCTKTPEGTSTRFPFNACDELERTFYKHDNCGNCLSTKRIAICLGDENWSSYDGDTSYTLLSCTPYDGCGSGSGSSGN